MKCSLFPFFFLLAIRWGGGGDFGSGSGSKFNCAARVGSGWVRQSRVRAGIRASVLSPCRPLAIATPAAPPGSDGSGCPEGRTVSPSGSVEVSCHELASLSAVLVQAPRRSGRLRRLPDKLMDYELH